MKHWSWSQMVKVIWNNLNLKNQERTARMSAERQSRHRNGHISREQSLGSLAAILTNFLTLTSLPSLIFVQGFYILSFWCQLISDCHKILNNYKLEDFDMVKTIGTGEFLLFVKPFIGTKNTFLDNILIIWKINVKFFSLNCIIGRVSPWHRMISIISIL